MAKWNWKQKSLESKQVWYLEKLILLKYYSAIPIIQIDTS